MRNGTIMVNKFYQKEWIQWYDNGRGSWFDDYDINPKKCLLAYIMSDDGRLSRGILKDYFDHKNGVGEC